MRTWLREIRVHKGLNQSEAARKIGISPSSYGDIERSFRNPSPKRAKEIGSAMGFDWTLFFEEN